MCCTGLVHAVWGNRIMHQINQFLVETPYRTMFFGKMQAGITVDAFNYLGAEMVTMSRKWRSMGAMVGEYNSTQLASFVVHLTIEMY